MRDPGFWTLLLRAGTEAGVVGGLADWFAVTAIFRRPLGLPIPHTGIVAAQKERIGRGIGGFVERNFLAPTLVAERLAAVDSAARLAAWLAAEDNAAAVADRLVASLPALSASVEDRGLREFVGRTIGEELRGVELAPILGRMLHVLTSTGEYDRLFDKALDAAAGMIRTGAPRIQAIIERHSSWWVPKAIDRRIRQTILQGLEDLVEDLRRPESAGRREFRAATECLVTELLESPEHRARVEEVKARLLAHPDIQAWLASVWDQVRGTTLSDLARPAESSRTRSTLVSLLASCGQALADDPALRQRLNGAVADAVVGAAASLWGEIGGYIADVVRGWDTRDHRRPARARRRDRPAVRPDQRHSRRRLRRLRAVPALAGARLIRRRGGRDKSMSGGRTRVPVIRFPGDQADVVGFGHQWKSTLPL